MRLRGYHERPQKLRFFSKPNQKPIYYIGVELEVEAPSQEAREEGLAKQDRPGMMFANRDGSLNSYGWEIITHPIDPELWLTGGKAPQKFFSLISDLRSLDYSSHDGGRCGMHVHISRTTFPSWERRGNLKCGKFFWFSKIVNGELFLRLSQRNDTAFCRQDRTLTPQNFTDRKSTRYTALNLLPSNTVEVRLPRGNTREDRIRKNIESVIAALEFAEETAKICSDEIGEYYCPETESQLDSRYIAWVVTHAARFPNLVSYLGELGLVQQSEDREGVAVCA